MLVAPPPAMTEALPALASMKVLALPPMTVSPAAAAIVSLPPLPP